MRQDRFDSSLQQDFRSFAQPRDAEDVGCSPLEAVRKLRRLHRRRRVAAGSSFPPWGNDGALPDDQTASSGRPQEGLVTGEGEEVDGVLFDIDGYDTGALRGVDQQEGAALTCDPSDGSHRLDGTRNI